MCVEVCTCDRTPDITRTDKPPCYKGTFQLGLQDKIINYSCKCKLKTDIFQGLEKTSKGGSTELSINQHLVF